MYTEAKKRTLTRGPSNKNTQLKPEDGDIIESN